MIVACTYDSNVSGARNMTMTTSGIRVQARRWEISVSIVYTNTVATCAETVKTLHGDASETPTAVCRWRSLTVYELSVDGEICFAVTTDLMTDI